MSNKPKRTLKGEFGGVYGPGSNLNIGKNKTTQELSNNIPESNLNSNEMIENNIERSRSRINSRNKINSKLYTKSKVDTKVDSKVDTKDLTDSIDLSRSNDSESYISNKHADMKEILKIPSISNISNGLTSTTSSISSPFKIMYIFIIIIILIIVSLFFFYKDQILKFFDTIFNKSNTSKVDGETDTSESDKSESDKVVTESDKIDKNIPAKIDDIDKKVNTLVSNSHSHDPAVKTLNNKLNNISPYKESNVTSDGFCYIGYDDGQRECVDVYQGDVCMSGEIFPSLDICINPKLRS